MRYSKSGQSKNNRRDIIDDMLDDDDMFRGMGMGSMLKNFGFGGFGGMGGMRGFGRDPFEDDFFSSPFGGMEQMMSEMRGMGGMGNMRGGGFGGTSQSISTSTIIRQSDIFKGQKLIDVRNGKKVTVTKTTITKPDGTSHTEVHENVQDDGRTLKDERYVANGQSNHLFLTQANQSLDSRLDYNRANSNPNPSNNQKALGYGGTGSGSFKGRPKYQNKC